MKTKTVEHTAHHRSDRITTAAMNKARSMIAFRMKGRLVVATEAIGSSARNGDTGHLVGIHKTDNPIVRFDRTGDEVVVRINHNANFQEPTPFTFKKGQRVIAIHAIAPSTVIQADGGDEGTVIHVVGARRNRAVIRFDNSGAVVECGENDVRIRPTH